MMTMKRSTWLAAVLVLGIWRAAGGAVRIGDQAPPLRIAAWIKGQPITLAEGRGKNVFVVEFWATWCGPCMQSIPHLSEVQAQFAHLGVVVIGVTDEPSATVKGWLAQQKELRMDYRVASDPSGRTMGAYVQRGTGIPHAFVVDKTGVVVWEGHPMSGLEYVLDGAVAGTLDPAKEARKKQIRDRAFAALRRGSLADAMSAMDQLIAADPQDAGGYAFKLWVLEMVGKTDEVGTLRKVMAERFPDNPRVLDALARHYATADDLVQRQPGRALQVASRAVELTEGKNPAFLATLARVYYALCRIDEAIETQKKAVAAASGAAKAEGEAVLQYYRKVKSLRQRGSATRPSGG